MKKSITTFFLKKEKFFLAARKIVKEIETKWNK